jgi:preprotein translocase subunit SecD
MAKLKYRIFTIVACVIVSLWSLFPRQVVSRVNHGSGFEYDTLQRVPLKLGLDLQGGMYVSLQIDEAKGAVADKSDALDRALKVVRQRIDEFGVSEPIVQKVGTDEIVVELPGLTDPQRALGIVKSQAFLQFQITDKTQALEKVAGRLDAIVKERGILASAKATDTTHAAAPTKSLFAKADSGKKRDSTKKDTAATASGIFSTKVHPTNYPGSYYIAAADFPVFDRALADTAVTHALPPGKVIKWGIDSATSPMRTFYVLEDHAIITGDALTSAQPQQSPTEGTIVSFKLTNEGGRKFRAETSKHIGDYMAIVLDDKVMSAPVINGAIGSDGEIQMGRGRAIAEAQDLALVLRAGALPVPLKVAQVTTIGPTLGKDSIDAGIRAGVLAIALIVIILGTYYRFSGLLAVGGLMLYMLFTLAILASFQATLTLPGLAGFVLSIGIAVDANILIFERIREELVAGKTVRLAIDEGFRHAMNAIVDSNVSTALTAGVLYNFGTGPVKGFAVTLLAGILASLFTAIFVVRTFYQMYLASRKGEVATLSI